MTPADLQARARAEVVGLQLAIALSRTGLGPAEQLARAVTSVAKRAATPDQDRAVLAVAARHLAAGLTPTPPPPAREAARVVPFAKQETCR